MNKKHKRNSRKSLKGSWGHIGAPPKTVKWPKRPFTMAQLFDKNSKGANKQCELSLRNKVEAGVKDGTILELKAKKQPHGSVGRPKSVFVLKANYDKTTMTLADKQAKSSTKTTRKATKPATPATVAVAPAVPAAAPVVESAPAAAAPVTVSDTPAPAPAPVVETAPVSAVAPVAEAPAAPAPAAASAPTIGS